jgi:membrane protease YdiL (CAAX protease family)
MPNFLKENKISATVYIILILTIILLLPSIGIIIAFGIVSVVVLLNRKDSILQSIGFISSKNWLRTILFCLSLGILIELSMQVFFNPIFEYITSSTINLSAFDNVRGNIMPYLIMLLIGWIVGGFIEEITFRGYLITRLIKILGDKHIVRFFILMVTSIPFGLSHLYQGWAGVLSTATVAFIFGLVFFKSNFNIWYPILTHGFVNSVGFSLMYFNADIVIQNIW